MYVDHSYTYEYDGNGSIKIKKTYAYTTGTLADTVGAVNPFRYKNYYYDSETRLYYLRSRSYDPVVGRFHFKLLFQ